VIRFGPSEGFKMSIPSNIDSEAIRLLEEADWPWHDFSMAFVKARNPEQETTEQHRSHPPDQISYVELRDHGLAGPASTARREAGLQWLRGRLFASS
jgi:hypothetical protein